MRNRHGNKQKVMIFKSTDYMFFNIRKSSALKKSFQKGKCTVKTSSRSFVLGLHINSSYAWSVA